MIMRRGAKRRWTTAVVCAGRVASPRDVSVVDRGSNGSTAPLAMRAKTRSQSSAANEGRCDHEVAARCAELQPTLPSRLEHEMASVGFLSNNNGSFVNMSLGQVLLVRARSGVGMCWL